MALPAPLHETLIRVVAMMAEAKGRWWIIGSAAVALHGATDGQVADVDLLIGDVAEARHLVGAFGMAPADAAPHAVFRSDVFGRWDGAPLTVELMAGFCHRRAGEWRPVVPRTRLRLPWAGGALFVPDRAELVAMLAAFARPKDFARAAALGG